VLRAQIAFAFRLIEEPRVTSHENYRRTEAGGAGRPALRDLRPVLLSTQKPQIPQCGTVVRAAQRLRAECELRASTADTAGWTLIELMIVVTIILILVTMAIPNYTMAVRRAREAVLHDDLRTMRHVVDEYTVDKQQPPQQLQDLVDSGYLHTIPKDPITGSDETWQVDIEEVPTSSADQTQSGIVDVHSGSTAMSLEGTRYNTW
jgi:general secretion pathway protein G